MNTTVYELKQYYVAAGGEAETVENITTIPDMIAAITALGAGGGGGVLDVTCSIEQGTHGETTYTLNKTWKEIHDAFTAGTDVIVTSDNGVYISREVIYSIGKPSESSEEEYYFVDFGTGMNVKELSANNENGYPTYMST